MNFGCLKETPSIRNYDYDIVCGASKIEIPTEYILPDDRLPKVRNQGSVGACVAFACVEILEVFNRMELNSDKTFSAGFFYGYNRPDWSNGWGMIPSSALNYFMETGSVPTSMFDELKEMPEMKKLVQGRKDLAEIAKKYRIKGYSSITSPNVIANRDKVRKALLQCQYPLLAISNKYFGESHAIILIGWNEEGWIIQNSWGEAWGNKGRKTVPYTSNGINYIYVLHDEVFEMKFKDVSKDAWYYNPIKEAVFTGIMNGKSEEIFDPDSPPTRAEMAQFGVNLMKKINEILETQK